MNPSIAIKAFVENTSWVDAGTREVGGKTYSVRSTKPDDAFWSVYKTAKEDLKNAGIFAVKDDADRWAVEHLQLSGEGKHNRSGQSDPVVKIPPSDCWEATEAPSVVMASVDRLFENPLNAILYDRAVSPAILESVEKYGVKVPLRALQGGMLLDGHQRLDAAKSAGYKYVPVIYEDVEDGHEIEAILGYNSQRIKSLPERLREYREYLKIEVTKAHQRAGVRTDIGAQLPEGQEEWGKSRDLAAKKVGMSGSSAERGLRVLEAIGKYPDSEHAAEAMNRLLNRGVDPAFKFIYSLGWIDSAVKNTVRKKAVPPDPQDSVGSSPQVISVASDETSEPGTPVSGWLTDDLIDSAITDVSPADTEATEELRKTISYLRPRVYLVAGTRLEASVVPKLRAVAKVVDSLADKCAAIASPTESSASHQDSPTP